jgi:hypothetical protein
LARTPCSTSKTRSGSTAAGAGVLTLADSNALDVAEGTLSFRFEAASLSSMQGLYSRDAIFHSGDAEHMSIFLTGTTLRVQIESQYKTQVLNFDGVQAGDETHVAVTFDGNEVTLYVDGQEADSVASTYTQATSPEATHFGALSVWSRSGTEYNSNPFNGEISDIAIYDAALASDDISTLAGTAAAPEPAPEPAPVPEPEPDARPGCRPRPAPHPSRTSPSARNAPRSEAPSGATPVYSLGRTDSVVTLRPTR